MVVQVPLRPRILYAVEMSLASSEDGVSTLHLVDELRRLGLTARQAFDLVGRLERRGAICSRDGRWRLTDSHAWRREVTSVATG